MFFYYFDSQGQIHQSLLPNSFSPIIDIDLQWLTLGHCVYPMRLHGLACFEKILPEVPEEHQFTFRAWYDSLSRSTHCIWYAIPNWILKKLPKQNIQAKSLAFVLHRFFPPALLNKSVVCFVDLMDCEAVIGYVRGQCVCFKKLPSRTQLNMHHEWQYLQQAYPQWQFQHSVYLTANQQKDNFLNQAHQHTIYLDSGSHFLANRMKLYGIC